MDVKRVVGRNAGVQKYDVLTAMAIAGMHSGPMRQTSMLRLIALVTARYNWRAQEFSVGQRDIAKLWDVNERTVKREIKRLCESNILICKRKGVRGRVGAYALNIEAIYSQSAPYWESVGPDYQDRMSENLPQSETKVVTVNFRPESPETENAPSGTSGWPAAMARLRAKHPSDYSNWYAHLVKENWQDGQLTLKASSGFVARYIETHLAKHLLNAVEAELGPVARLIIAH